MIIWSKSFTFTYNICKCDTKITKLSKQKTKISSLNKKNDLTVFSIPVELHPTVDNKFGYNFKKCSYIYFYLKKVIYQTKISNNTYHTLVYIFFLVVNAIYIYIENVELQSEC